MSYPVYDKAKWHYDGVFPQDLPPEQAFVHTGMFLGWLIERRLTSANFESYAGPLVAQFRRRELTGPQVYARAGELLAADMLSDEGNKFTQAYYESKYMNDYFDELGGMAESVYHVEDTWLNYEKIKEVIDERLARWKREGRV